MSKNAEKIVKTGAFCAILVLFGALLAGCGGSSPIVSTGSSAQQSQTRARAIVAQSLESDDARLRAKATEVVVDTGLSEYMPKLQNLLTDDFVPVRFSAAMAIAKAEYAPARQTLQMLLRDSEHNVRLAAAFALYRLGDSQQIQTLYDALGADNQTVRANAVFLLGKTQNPEAIDRLYAVLRGRSSTEQVRLQAAEAIARLGDEQIYKRIWTMLISAFADDRAMGVSAMGALDTLEAEGALVSMLSDTVTEVRLIAAAELAKQGDPRGSSVITEAMRSLRSSDPEEAERIKGLAAMAIGELCNSDVRGFLPTLIEDQSPFVRLSAARAVLRCAD